MGKVGKMGKGRGRHARRMRLTALRAAMPPPRTRAKPGEGVRAGEWESETERGGRMSADPSAS